MKSKILRIGILASMAFLIGIATLVSCKKNPINALTNFKVTVTPAMFEYSASITVFDAADSLTPKGLKIVLDEENSDFFYDILGSKTLKFSDNGVINVGLNPSIKPTDNEPVVVRFSLEADNYISETFSITFNKGIFSLEENFPLMNKNNLPDGVSYTEFSAPVSNGETSQDIEIDLDGGTGGRAGRGTSGTAINRVTLKAGTKFVFWEYNRNTRRWNRQTVTDNGQIQGTALYYVSFAGNLGWRAFENSYIVEGEDTTQIPTNKAMYGVGGWRYVFRLNGRFVYPEWQSVQGASGVASLGLPRWAYNQKTNDAYKSGDVINLYNFKYVWDWDGSWNVKCYFDKISTQTLGAIDPDNSDYFRLSDVNVNSLNNVWIGEIFDVVRFNQNPVVTVANDNSEPSNSNNTWIYQYLLKPIVWNNRTYNYYVGYYATSINRPTAGWGWNSHTFLVGNYTKRISFKTSQPISAGSEFSQFQWVSVDKSITVSPGGQHPYDEVIPNNLLQRNTVDITIVCGNKQVKPSFFLVAAAHQSAADQENNYSWWNSTSGFITNGRASTYDLKVGLSYKFFVTYEGQRYMKTIKIEETNTVFNIMDESWICARIP